MNIEFTNILIIGGESKIGKSLAKFFSKDCYKIYKTTRNKSKLSGRTFYLDLEKTECFDFGSRHYKIIFFCAALTSIQKCEDNPSKAHKINYINTLKLTKYFVEANSHVIHFSTTNIFSGENKIEKLNSKPDPKTVYGKTKTILEKALINLNGCISIIRTTKIIFKSNTLFFKWINDLKLNKKITPFNDVYFSPISIQYLLSIIEIIIKFKLKGIHNISSLSDISYEEASVYIAKKLNLNKKLIDSISHKNILKTFIPKYTNLENTFLKYFPAPKSTEAIDYFLSKNYE